MKRDKTDLILHSPDMVRSMLMLALPIFGANFIKAFNDLVDTFFIGQIPGSVAAQAGMSSTWTVLQIGFSLQIGLSTAGVAVISQYIGAGRRGEAVHYAGNLTLMAVILGIIFEGIIYGSAPAVMRQIGAEGAVYDSAVTYLQVRSFEMIFVFLFSAFQAIRQANGDTVTPVMISTLSIVLNIVLTGIFVRILGWGVAGAAWATVIGNMAGSPFVLWLLFRREETFHLQLPDLKLQKPILARLFRLAVPPALSEALGAFGFLIMQALILSYGEVVAAAFSICNKINNMLMMPMFAIGTVLVAYVGQNIGACNPDRARKAYRLSRNISLIFACAAALILLPTMPVLIRLLTNSSATVAVAMEYMVYCLMTMPLMALFQNNISVFNGSGNTQYTFLLVTGRLWAIRLPLIMFFKSFTALGEKGIWYSMVISNAVVAVAGALLFGRIDFRPRFTGESEKGN